jgi:NADH:ubiquinone oxidoreductase subunit F (NADH-binding)
VGRHSLPTPAGFGADEFGVEQTQPIPTTPIAAPRPSGAPNPPAADVGLPIPMQRDPLACSGPLPRLPAGMPPPPLRPSAPRPRPVEAAPRLLEPTEGAVDLAEHLARHGELPRSRFAGRRGAGNLLELTARAGLRGRGGAGFPTARKMAAVLEAASARRRPVVVANGCEGDPTSAKDALLVARTPHLVLDGIALAAHTVGADQAMLCVHRGSPVVGPLESAIAERPDDPAEVHVVTVPRRYVASESSALVNFLTGGEARPLSAPRTARRGVQGRPTLVDNVETLAHLALIARHGAEWFRERGTRESPGTALMTVTGAVRRPGVLEVDLGTGLGEVLARTGGPEPDAEAVLVGGLGGQWLPWPADAALPLCHDADAAHRLGIASLVVLPAEVCGLSVTATLLRYLAEESAGQCGPCRFGLPAVAEDLAAVALGRADAGLGERLGRRLGVIPGRGACAHPDGAVRMAASALRVFAADVVEHLAGRPCRRPDGSALPPVNQLPIPEGGWR